MPRLLVVLLLCLSALPARAAEGDAPNGISIRLFAVAVNKNQGPVCFMTGEVRGPAFEIPTTNLSDAQVVKARKFTLVSASASTESPPVPVASIHLPDQGSDFRVILVPKAGGSYKSVVVRADDSKFSNGDFFFINLSNHEMLGKLGSTSLALKPGGQELVRPAGAESKKFFEVKFAGRSDGKIIPLTNTCWPVVRDNRSFVIFHNNARGRPTYRAVDEFMILPVAGNP